MSQDHDQRKSGLAREAGTPGGAAPAGPAAPGKATRTGPLSAPLQARMERAFGASLDDVRIHEDGEADAAGARALTRGNDVHFAAGAYDPDSAEGMALLGHELTHVVQQRQGSEGVQAKLPDDGAQAPGERPALEREADAVGARIAAGGSAGVIEGRVPPGSEQHDDKTTGGGLFDEAARIMQRPFLPRTLPRPLVMEVIGDRFLVSFEKDRSYRLVVVVTYAGPLPAAQKTVRLVAPAAWGSEDLAWNARILDVRPTGLTIDLTGDMTKLVTVGFDAKPDGTTRVHRVRSELNRRHGDDESIALQLPEQKEAAPDASPEEIAAERPVRLATKLGPDPMTLVARRFGESGSVHLLLDGASQGMASRPDLLVPVPGKSVALKVLGRTDRTLDLDLDGDGKLDVRLFHTIRKPRMIGGTQQRWHDVVAYDARGRIIDRATYVMRGEKLDVDPALLGSEHPAPAGELPDHDVPPVQGDVPIEAPTLETQYGVEEMRVDVDGDRRKEMLLRFHRGKDLRVTLIQLSSGLGHTVGPLPLSEENQRSHVFEPEVTRAADGYRPLEIDLFSDYRYHGIDHPKLLIEPPRVNDPQIGMDRAIRVHLGDQAETVGYAPEPTSRVALAGEDGVKQYDPKAKVHAVEAALGELGDRFLFTIEHNPDGPTFGVAGLGDAGAVAGGGIRVRAIDPLGLNLRKVSDGPGHVGFAIGRSDDADIVVHDAIQASPGLGPTVSRDHRLTVHGPAVAGDFTTTFHVDGRKFTRQAGFGAGEVVDREAAGAAHAAVTIAQQELEGTDVATLIGRFEAGMDGQVVLAGQKGWIPKPVFDAWMALQEGLVMLQVQAATPGGPDVTLRQSVAASAATMYRELRAISGMELKYREDSRKGKINHVTGDEISARDYTGGTHEIPGPFARLSTQLAAGDFANAGPTWKEARKKLAEYANTRITQELGDDSQESRQGRYMLAMHGQLDDIKSESGVMRVPATFIADESHRTEQNFHESVPLQLYIWRDGTNWTIRDCTNPERPWTGHATGDGTAVPPKALFDQLDDKKAFAKGVIRYHVPGGPSDRVTCEARKKWYEWVADIGLALAVIGLSMVTLGAGTVVAVAGGWVLAASLVAGAVASGAEMVDDYRHGILTPTTVLLNLLQIAANVSSIGAIVAGNLVRGATAAARAGANWTGRMASLAKFADKAYIPFVAGAAGADVATVAVMGFDTAMKLQEIDRSGAPEEVRSEAKRNLLLQAVVMGGLTAMSIKGDIPTIRSGQSNIVLDMIGDIPVAHAGGVRVGDFEMPHLVGDLHGAATARWHNPELEDVMKGADAEWYEAWLAQKEKVTFGPRGEPQVKLPAIEGKTMPPHVQEHLEGLARRPEFAAQQRAFATADELAQLREVSDGLDIDPTSPIWPQERERLITKLGGGKDAAKLVDRYAAARLGGQGVGDLHATQRARLEQVIPQGEVDAIAKLFPEFEVYVSGGPVAAGKGGGRNASLAGEIDVVVVVPANTSTDLIGAIEQRARAHRAHPDPDYAKAAGLDTNETLRLDVKVVTPDQMFGLATARAKGAVPAEMHRIDTPVDIDGRALSKAELEAFQKAGYEYNAETRQFELRGERSRLAFGAETGPLRAPHSVIGNPLPSIAAGEAVMRKLAVGDAQALHVIGVDAGGLDTRSIEWGLGRRTKDGSIVLVQGDVGEVNWSKLPGIEPLAHSHPLYTNSAKPSERFLKGLDGSGSVTIAEIRDNPKLFSDMVHLFPSASDIATAGGTRGAHKVVTPYVLLPDGRIGNPTGAAGEIPVEVDVLGSVPIGMQSPGSANVLYETRLRFSAGGQELGVVKVHAAQTSYGSMIQFADDAGRPSGVFQGYDPKLAPGVRAGDTSYVPATGSTRGTTHAPQKTELELALDQATTETLAQRQHSLGFDPDKNQYVPHEGDVGPAIEVSYGYFRRAPNGGDWQSLSGPYAGKTFDLMGVPQDRASFIKPGRWMRDFIDSVDDHMLKRVEYVIIDIRHFPGSPSTLRDEVKKHVDTKWAAEKGRVIYLE